MGWLVAILMSALTLSALWKSGRCSRLALEIAGAAVLMAAAGYAWQGRPDLPGRPTQSPPVLNP